MRMDTVTAPLRDSWVRAVHEQMEPHGRVIYASLKGSRLNGVAGPTSDVDLRCVFLAPTERILGLSQPQHTVERAFAGPDGEEMDFVAYEAARFMHHTLKHNGNMVESLLVPEGFFWADERGVALRERGKRFVTKKLYSFYRGYAQGQFERACKQITTGKGLIATFRELYQGIHVLRLGCHEFDLPTLSRSVEALLGWESRVLPACRRDREIVDDSLLRKAQQEYDYLNGQLEAALMESRLPEDYEGREKFERLLLAWRSAGWR